MRSLYYTNFKDSYFPKIYYCKKPEMKSIIPLLRTTLLLIIILLFFYAIISAKQFLYPITLASLFAYLLYPIVNFLEKKGIARILANLMAILFLLIVIGSIFTLFYKQLTSMFNDFESLRESANENIELLQYNIQSILGMKGHRLEEFLKNQVNQFFISEEGGLTKLFSATTGTLFKIFLLPIYIFLFLYYRTKFAYFILKVVKKENKQNTLNILRDISTVAARYMGGVSIVVLILCVLNSVGLLIIGVKYAILLGFISAFFNFIPYFGTLLGGSIPMIFVLLTTNEPGQYGIKVLILFTIIQFTENNILTPNIVGNNVKINPFFIILGLVVGGMTWGIPGMIVIVPFLAILRIVFNHVERLKPFGYLLGPRGTKQHSVTINKIKHAFKFWNSWKK